MSCTIPIMLSQAFHSKFLYNEFTMNFLFEKCLITEDF